MQLEDKLVEDFGAARAESQQREDVLAHGEDQLPEAVTEAVSEASVQLRGKLLGAIRMVLADEEVAVADLQLPAHEAHALDALQIAVSGRSTIGKFVFACDRRDLLEQALAVLQPNLLHADDKSARALHAQFAELTSRVGELRHTLTNLEDAQDELIEGQLKPSLEQGETDPSDKPKPSDPDAPRPATTLTGPELPEAPAPPTTLVGPDLPAVPARPTTLVGTELPEAAARPTTLVGADLPEAPAAPSTLGDPAELAAQAQIPWWRRPFG